MKNLLSQLFLLLSAGLVSVNAQSIKTHTSVESKFDVPNAKVTYTYYLDENGHEVRHGAYSITGTNTETVYGHERGIQLISKTTRTINLTASFKHGKLNGNLTFRSTETESDNGKVSGKTEWTFSCHFNNGAVSAPFEQILYKNGSPTQILKTGLKDGNRVGAYRALMHDPNGVMDVDVTGAFDNDGNMTGRWKFKSRSEERLFEMLNGYVTSYAFYKSGSAKPLATIDSKIKPIAQSYAKGAISPIDLIRRGYIAFTHGGIFSYEPLGVLKAVYSQIGIDDNGDFQETNLVYGMKFPVLRYKQKYIVENLSPDLIFNDAKSLYMRGLKSDGCLTLTVNPDKSVTLFTSNEDYVLKIVGDTFAESVLNSNSILWYYEFDIPAEIVQSWVDERQSQLEKLRIKREEEAMRLAEEKRKEEARAAWIVSAGEKMDAFTAKLLSVSNEHRSEILAAKTGGSTGTLPCLDSSEWESLVDGYSLEKMLGLMPVLKISPVGKGKDNQYADYLVTFEKTGPAFSAETKQVRIYMREAETPRIDLPKSFMDMKDTRGPWDQILEKVDSISSVNNAFLAEAADQKALAPFLNAYQNYHNACDLNGSPNLEETEARIEKTLKTHQRYYRKLEEIKTIANNDAYLKSALAPYKALMTAYSKYMDAHPLVWNDTLPEDSLQPVLFAQDRLKSAIQDQKVAACNAAVKSESQTLPEQWFSAAPSSRQLYLLERAETAKFTKDTPAEGGWINSIEAGLFPVDKLFSDDEGDRHSLDLFPGIGYSIGYKTGSGLYFGVALDVTKTPDTADNPVLPIEVLASGDGRFYFNKARKLQPYIGARVGVALTADIEGSFVNPNFGISYNLGGKKMVFGTLGYMHYLGGYYTESENGPGMISATVGFAF